MATTPGYATIPRLGAAKLILADTALDNPTTNPYTVLQGVDAGTRIDRVIIIRSPSTASANAAATVVRLWFNDGTRNNLYKDQAFALQAIPAAAGANQVLMTRYEIATPNLVLPSAACSLKATTSIRGAAQDDIVVIAVGSDLGGSAPSYAPTPRASSIRLETTADAAISAPATTYLVFTPGSSGSRVDRLIARHSGIIGTSTNANTNAYRIYLNDGSANYLFHEMLIAQYTPGNTSVNVGAEFTPNNLVLPSTWRVRASLHFRSGGDVRDEGNVLALGADI